MAVRKERGPSGVPRLVINRRKHRGRGWFGEPKRHAQAARGVKTARIAKRHAMVTSAYNWKHLDAATSVDKLSRTFGLPDYGDKEIVGWKNVAGFSRVEVRDESVVHSFPTPHRDWLYSTKKLRVPSKLMDDFARVTGSILVDGLKGEVTTRCQMMVKNAVTMGFVEDVIAGRIKATKAEYARRIKGNVTPRWYKDELKEK